MSTAYQARWVSKDRRSALRKRSNLGGAVLLDSFNGWIIVEPVGSDLGDGEVMGLEAADYELRPVWCPGSKAKLAEARRLLGLEAEAAVGRQLVAAGVDEIF